MVLAMWLDTLQHARTDGKSPGASCLPITVVRFARTSSVRARDLRSAPGPPCTGLQGRQPHDGGLSLGLILDDQGVPRSVSEWTDMSQMRRGVPARPGWSLNQWVRRGVGRVVAFRAGPRDSVSLSPGGRGRGSSPSKGELKGC